MSAAASLPRVHGRVAVGALLACVVIVPAVVRAEEGADFAHPARLLYRTAACGSGDELPRDLPAPVVDAHRRQLAKAYAEDRTLSGAAPARGARAT